MRIAITGGKGFVGRNIGQRLLAAGHEIVVIRRQGGAVGKEVGKAREFAVGLDSVDALAEAFAGCEAVAHCAGINREIGEQTYQRVHIEGTRNVVEAAMRAGVKKILLISFLRARANCGSGYHESKFAAEEIVRASGLDYTILKCGVIYGRGDHMLDHLSHAFHTFPVFAFVGMVDKPVRPMAVEDVAGIGVAALVEGALSRKTVAVVGPETLKLREAVLRVARVCGKRPVAFPLPLWFHYAFGWLMERLMKVPLVSIAQVRILSEGLTESSPSCEALPPELAPQIKFTEAQIRAGLPPTGAFGLRDLRCCDCWRAATVGH